MRLKRHKICVNDFEHLTIIGRGAFGEVRTISVCICAIYFVGYTIFSVLFRTESIVVVAAISTVFSPNLFIYRLDYVGRRNLETSMP